MTNTTNYNTEHGRNFAPVVQSILQRLRDEERDTEFTFEAFGKGYSLSHDEAEKLSAFIAFLEASANPEAKTVSLEEAANYLNVTESDMEKIIVEEELPFAQENEEKRIELAPLKAYKTLYKSRMKQSLSRLAEQAQNLNMGY